MPTPGITAILSLALGLATALTAGAGEATKPEFSSAELRAVSSTIGKTCDPGTPLSPAEREDLFEKLRISNAGAQILRTFKAQYHSLENLVIHWNSTSYSQIGTPQSGRSIASAGRRAPASSPSALGPGVCVYLARKLPVIEHIADLAHELIHATRLDPKVLRGEVRTADQFIYERLAGQGGEAEAFSAECRVKFEILGYWDGLCSPYVANNAMNRTRVLDDLYNGELSASLTGESYPTMLERQFRVLLLKKGVLENQEYSGLENKNEIQ